MKTFLLACVLALSAASAQAAVVHLKEGGYLEGVIITSTQAEVVIETAQGRVRVEMSRVRSIDQTAVPAPQPFAAPAASGEERPRRFFRRGDEAYAAGRQMLSVDLGLAAPMSGVRFSWTSGGGTVSNGGPGPALGLQYLYYGSPNVGWGLDFHSCSRGASESSGLFPSGESRVFGDTMLLLGVVKANLTDRGPVRPFVLLGAGGHLSSTVIDVRPLPGFAWSDTQTDEARRLVNGTAGGLAATARLGLDFGFADPSVFSLEAGWTGLASASYRSTPQGEAQGISGVSGPVHYFTLTGRWGFSF